MDVVAPVHVACADGGGGRDLDKGRLKYPDVANESAGGGATAFYSGKQKTEDAAPSALSPLIGAALAGALAGAAAAILVVRRR